MRLLVFIIGFACVNPWNAASACQHREIRFSDTNSFYVIEGQPIVLSVIVECLSNIHIAGTCVVNECPTTTSERLSIESVSGITYGTSGDFFSANGAYDTAVSPGNGSVTFTIPTQVRSGEQSTREGTIKCVRFFDDVSWIRSKTFYIMEKSAEVGVATTASTNVLEGRPGIFTFGRKIADGPATITFEVSGTATGMDYSSPVLASGKVHLAPGQQTTNVAVTTFLNRLSEPNKTITVTLKDDGFDFRPGARSATLTIIEDTPVVSVLFATNRFPEGLTNYLTFWRQGPTYAESLPVSIKYSVTGSATTNGLDYTPSLSGTATIGQGQAQVEIPIIIASDTLSEANESIGITISTNGIYRLGTNASTQMTIMESTPKVSASFLQQPSVEGVTNYLIFSRGVTNAPFPVEIGYSLGGSAVRGTDYTTQPGGSATIAQGYGDAVIPITLALDSVVEGDETIVVTVTNATMNGVAAIIATNKATNTVLDSTATINVEFLQAAAMEGDRATLRFYRSTNSWLPVTVNYSVGGTAVAGTDYLPKLSAENSTSGQIVFPAFVTEILTNVSAVFDTVRENTETLTVGLLQGASANYVIGAASSATLSITDATPVVSLRATTVLASESGRSGLFSFSRTGDWKTNLNVRYEITGTAQNGKDYAQIGNSVAMHSGETFAHVTVAPIYDGVVEGIETVAVRLLPGTGYVLGAVTNGTVEIHDYDDADRGAPVAGGDTSGSLFQRFSRGGGTDAGYHSFVVPIDFQKGIELDRIGGNGDVLFPNVPWTTLRHLNGSTNNARILFENPIVAFGGRVGGTPLYNGQGYTFGIYAGDPRPSYVSTNALNDALRIRVYHKATLALAGTINVPIPSIANATEWEQFLANGNTKSVAGFGLTTILSFNNRQWAWGANARGTNINNAFHLTHEATGAANNYVFMVELAGGTDQGWMVLSADNQRSWSRLYTVEFQPRPAWRSVFLDQPQFFGQPIPPGYQGRSLEEFLTNGFPVTNVISLANPNSYRTVDQSPELRRHPILDQFVADMGNDPILLANYVLNEIELTDAIDLNENSTSETSVNLGGVNRGALGTYLEGQGSPTEQCALLVYLLRQAGFPAVYVFPANNGLTLTDARLSKLLRFQIRGAVAQNGEVISTNVLIPVNYPWVATYVASEARWVHVFPWLKDTEVQEGLNLYDYMPAKYDNALKWAKAFMYGDDELMSLSPEDDSPLIIYPRFLEKTLRENAPGVALDDIGTKSFDRRHYYARWGDFPMPSSVSGTIIPIESLGSADIANVSPSLTKIFNTVRVEVSSASNPGKQVVSGELRTAELHNRRFVIWHEKIKTNEHRLNLSLAAFRPGTSSKMPFTAANMNDPADSDCLYHLTNSVVLNGSDDELVFSIVHKRNRALNGSSPAAYPGIASISTVRNDPTLRKGDVAAICSSVGRVTRKMIDQHATEIWKMEQAGSTGNDSFAYQGNIAYLMGLSYLEKLERFQTLASRLHKVQPTTMFASGLARLSAARGSDGKLPSGNIILSQPVLDIFSQQIVSVGNQTLHLDSGDDGYGPLDRVGELMIVAGSALEHWAINQFFGQSDAVSTVQLLRMAHRGSGVVALNSLNYQAEGEKLYPTGSNQRLREADPGMWGVLSNMFADYRGNNVTVQAYITPGKIRNHTGSFHGVGLMIFGPRDYYALIDTSLNGAVGEELPSGLLDHSNVRNISVRVDPGNYVELWEDPYSQNINIGTSETVSWTDFPWYADSITSGMIMDPVQSGSIDISQFLLFQDSGGSLQNQVVVAENNGTQRPNQFSLWELVSDPVNAVTGEFYSDTVDLKLPGPMSLDIRRNYSSHDVFDSEFGYGWKISYVPFLSLSADSTNGLIYAAEPDGSVLVYRRESTNGTPLPLWKPSKSDNPRLQNVSGPAGNLLNASIGKTWVNGVPQYTLNSPDGGRRVFAQKSFPTEIWVPPALNVYDSVTWKFLGGKDLNGDRQNDLIFRKTTDPTTYAIWYMRNANERESNVVTTAAADLSNLIPPCVKLTSGYDKTKWVFLGGKNYNSDNTVDFLFQAKDGTGYWIWYMNGAQVLSRTNVATANTSGLIPPAPGVTIARTRPYLDKWTDSAGNYLEFSYGLDPKSPDYGKVRRVEASNGNFLGFNYDSFGHIVLAYTGDGRRLEYDYDQYGDLVRVEFPDASEIRYEYKHDVLETNGLRQTYSTHLLIREHKPEGRVLQNDYDNQRRVIHQYATVGADLRLVRNGSFTYSNNFSFASMLTNPIAGYTLIKDCVGNVHRYEYAKGLITRILDPVGGEEIKVWYEDGDHSIGAYPGSLKRTIDKRGLRSDYKYDFQGNVTNIAVTGDLTGTGNTNEVAVSEMFYNANRLLTNAVDPVGNRTVYTYTNSLSPYLRTSEERYVGSSATPVAANVFEYYNVTSGSIGSYGLLRRTIRAHNSPDEATTEWKHAANGFITNQVKFTGTADPAITNLFFYNLRGELVEQADHAGRRTVYSYDGMGRLQWREVFDESGNRLSGEYSYYNQNGELVWSDGPRFDPEDYVWRDYDGAGRKVQEVRWRSRSRADGKGVEAEVGNALYSTTFYEYDHFGNLTKVIDPRGNYTRKYYDKVGRVVREESFAPGGLLLTTNGVVYSKAGDVRWAFNGLGGRVVKEYTFTGKPRRQVNIDGSTNGWTYYLDGRLKREYLSNGSYWQTDYQDSDRRFVRTLYSSSDVVLASQVSEFDRRGNAIKQTDAEGHVFETSYDDLDRVVSSSGPADSAHSERQTTLHEYDAYGIEKRTINALDEETVARVDALGRVTSTLIYNTDGSVARATGTSYSRDHHAVTNVLGTGDHAITNVAFTDTFGNGVLNQFFPEAGVVDFTRNIYDNAGNLVRSEDELGQPTTFTYDGLNRVKTTRLPDGATVSHAYDAAGNLTSKTMPGGLVWTATYDNASRMQTEFLNGNYRQFHYAYYPAGHVFAGQLQSVTDPRNVVTSRSYNDFLQLEFLEVGGTGESLVTEYGYDKLGRVTDIQQASDTKSTAVRRFYDGYGQITNEVVEIDGVIERDIVQHWDAAGRRVNVDRGMESGPDQYIVHYEYRADGRISRAGTAGVRYLDNGYPREKYDGIGDILVFRDGRGRIINTDMMTWEDMDAGGYFHFEGLIWRADSKLQAYERTNFSITFGENVESRSYQYNSRGQLTRENLMPERKATEGVYNYEVNEFSAYPGQSISLNYGFASIGVRNSMAMSGYMTGQWNVPSAGLGISTWWRVQQENSSGSHRFVPVFGNFEAGDFTGDLSSYFRVAVSLNNGFNRRASLSGLDWSLGEMDAAVGNNAVKATAYNGSGNVVATRTHTFTVAPQVTPTVQSDYDAAGNVITRTYTGQRTQTLTWDGLGRLVAVQERDTGNNGFNWEAVYDGLGRRVRTTEVDVTNGTATGQPYVEDSWFDPQVEFMEIGLECSGMGYIDWRTYGPDWSGDFGRLQGVRGRMHVFNDIFGNVIESDLPGHKLGSYGPIPGYPAPKRKDFWQGRRMDRTGFYWMGARYYEPGAGRFLSPDSLGHGATWDLYAYAGGDPVNSIDPDGRAVIQDWHARQVDLLTQGGVWNNVKAGGYSALYGGLSFFSLGSFNKNDRLVDRNLAGEISDAQLYSGMAVNGMAAGASLYTGGAAGTLTAGRLISVGASPATGLILSGGAAGFTASVTDIATTRAGYAMAEIKYEPTVTQDLTAVGISTGIGMGFGALTYAGMRGEGVVYNRTDANGIVDPYYGKAQSSERYVARQGEHAADFPASDFRFRSVDRGAPGDDLRFLEQWWITANGGARSQNRSTPLSNRIRAMNDADFWLTIGSAMNNSGRMGAFGNGASGVMLGKKH